jgi:ABC-2 type transport system ATP-binding protein
MLEIKNLTKSYGQRQVLQNLNLRLEPGKIYGLLGPNGAGKTTTINIICDLLKADSGTVKINQQSLSKYTKHWLGVAPQENLLYPQLSCEENLKFFGKIYGLKGTKLTTSVAASLTAVNLLGRKSSPVETLSGGMQRRVNIAVALVHQPKLLILDEPTTGLDIEARYEIWQLIQSLKNQGMTILLTTHLLDEAQKLCHQIGIIKEGKIVAEGSLNQLRQLVRAKEIVLMQTEEEERAIAKGKELGFTHRYYGNELAFWLPEQLELSQIINYFQGITINSLTRQAVGLEHIYLEVTQRNHG